VTAARLNQLGIFTGADLRAQPVEFLHQHFGKAGRYYHAIARAEDHRPVEADRLRKSVGSETTFAQDLTAFADLLEGLRPSIEEVWEYCQRSGILGRTATVKVKFNDFQQITRSRSSTGPIPSQAVLERICRELVGGLFPLEKGVRLLGVSLSNLNNEPAAGRQLTLSF
jgi:DNA polymerase-4